MADTPIAIVLVNTQGELRLISQELTAAEFEAVCALVLAAARKEGANTERIIAIANEISLKEPYAVSPPFVLQGASDEGPSSVRN